MVGLLTSLMVQSTYPSTAPLSRVVFDCTPWLSCDLFADTCTGTQEGRSIGSVLDRLCKCILEMSRKVQPHVGHPGDSCMTQDGQERKATAAAEHLGMRLSACMKHRRSPCAISAPAFIWRALPRCARITRAPACFASLAVLQACGTLSRLQCEGAGRYLQQGRSASLMPDVRCASPSIHELRPSSRLADKSVCSALEHSGDNHAGII